MRNSQSIKREQHSPSTAFIILLHLLPAVFWLMFYLPLARYASANGIPTMLVMYLLMALILVPFELGVLYYHGKNRNGKFSLNGIVLYRTKIPWLQYLIYSLVAFIWFMLVIVFGYNITVFVESKLFYWIPDWYYLSRGTIEQNSKVIESSMWILAFSLNALIAPITEELYFRGYLLPRLAKFGLFAPLLNVFLFMSYHFWQPQGIITMTIAFLPLIYFVWWKRNIYLSIGLHCFINLFGLTLDLLQRIT